MIRAHSGAVSKNPRYKRGMTGKNMYTHTHTHTTGSEFWESTYTKKQNLSTRIPFLNTHFLEYI